MFQISGSPTVNTSTRHKLSNKETVNSAALFAFQINYNRKLNLKSNTYMDELF